MVKNDNSWPSEQQTKRVKLSQMLAEAAHTNEIHDAMLSERLSEMQHMRDELPTNNINTEGLTKPQQLIRERVSPYLPFSRISKVWMDKAQLEEFASGSMAACFGPEYQVFEGRRHPRIPRGDLMLMSRIVKVNGTRHHLKEPAEIFGEFDFPENSWFTSEKYAQETALSAFMEMALQPCGVLSAYLGTALTRPEVDFYFRNLDGDMNLNHYGNLRGKTIQTWGKLTSTVMGADTILQRFDFSLSALDQVFFTGNTVFGYFHPQAMAAQNGFSTPEKAVANLNDAVRLPVHLVKERYGDARALMLHEAYLLKKDPTQSYVTLTGMYKINLADWFFKAHFYQDPVMPGSLGVEAVIQLLSLYAYHIVGNKNLASFRFLPQFDKNISWKYRGQILPTDKQMTVKVKVHQEQLDKGNQQRINLSANAEIWKDQIKIYEINQFTLQVCFDENH